MNHKTLNSQQVESLFTFCRKHHVYHYDLQIELVDHMASAIETAWETNPNLPFEEARNQCFSQFGSDGFLKVERQHEKALSKKYNHLLISHWISFFRWPKLLFTIASTLFLTFIFQLIDKASEVLIVYSLLIFFFTILYIFILFPKKYSINLIPGKSFLLIERLKSVRHFSVVFLQLPFIASNFAHFADHKYSELLSVQLSMSFTLVAFSILLYNNLVHLPSKIKSQFISQFPEFVK